MRRCDFKASVTHFREAINAPPLQDGLLIIREHSITRIYLHFDLALALLKKHSAANETEAFEMFQKELDNCQHPDRAKYSFIWEKDTANSNSGNKPSNLFSSISPYRGKTPTVNEVLAKTYLEQYCVDAALDTDQRREVLNLATSYSRKAKPSELTTGMHLTRSQLF